MILNGEIAPGTILSQVQVAKRLGVSTTPVREAMRLLQAEGLLEIERNRRARVPQLDVDDLDAVYSARVLLEAVAITLSVPAMTQDDLSELNDLLERMDRYAEAKDLAAWDVEHLTFHCRLVSAASPPQDRLIQMLRERSERYRHLSVLGSSPRGWTVANAEHQGIVDACVRREPQEAAVALARHLARTAHTLIAYLAPEADAAATRTAVQLVTNWVKTPA